MPLELALDGDFTALFIELLFVELFAEEELPLALFVALRVREILLVVEVLEFGVEPILGLFGVEVGFGLPAFAPFTALALRFVREAIDKPFEDPDAEVDTPVGVAREVDTPDEVTRD